MSEQQVTDVHGELQALLASLPSQGVKIVSKSDSWFYPALAKILYVISFGRFTDFMTNYVTTIGSTIAVPTTWGNWSDSDKLEVLTHELVHVGQFKRYSLPLMALLYLFAFLPAGLAYFRYRFERNAYVAGFKRTLQRQPSEKDLLVQFAVGQMTGASYLWAWPFKKSVQKYFQSQL